MEIWVIYGYPNNHQRQKLWMGTHNGSGVCMASLHPLVALSEQVMFLCMRS